MKSGCLTGLAYP